MWKNSSKRIQKTTRQCRKESSLGYLQKEQVRTQRKVVWACSRRSSREWTDQSTVEHKCPVWQSDRGQTTWPNSYCQERTKGINYWYCCTSWYKSRGKRKRESRKVPGFEQIDQKIVEIEKCRNWLVDGKARHNMQRWGNAKSVGNVKTKVFC